MTLLSEYYVPGLHIEDRSIKVPLDWTGHEPGHGFDGESISNPVDVMEGELFESPMKPFGGIEQLAWNTTSDKIAYTSRKKTGKEYAISTNSDIYVYDLNTKQTTNITEEIKGYDTNPTYSTD